MRPTPLREFFDTKAPTPNVQRVVCYENALTMIHWPRIDSRRVLSRSWLGGRIATCERYVISFASARPLSFVLNANPQ